MKLKLSISRTGSVTALACEFIGFSALWLAPDVEKALFLAPVLAGLLAHGFGFRLRDFFLLPLLAAIVVGGYAVAGAEPTGTLLARAIIPAHALLWLALDESLYRYWRIGLGLIELILAAILAPEAYMFVLIFFFVVLSSLSLSVAFLERNFRARDPASLSRPVRLSFLSAVLTVSFLIFLSSLVIFPILPRSKWGGQGAGATTGYGDTVNLRQSILYWTNQSSRPVAWIFRKPGQDWEKVVPFFLLRGQVLEGFRRDVWRSEEKFPSAIQRAGKETVEILRQPLPADVLPVPYGAGQLRGERSLGAVRYEGGEWHADGSRSRRVRYEVEIDSFSRRSLGNGPESGNSPSLHLPGRSLRELKQLASRISQGASSDEEKLERLRSWFQQAGFQYQLSSMQGAETGRHPVEQFLFETKKGHCELFASSLALLARGMGLPSRLVVGFRVRPPSRGDVLTVHSSDAHAWVEVYTNRRGWITMDPTPVVVERGWAEEAFGEIYDALNAYWALYILEYEFDFVFSMDWLVPLAGFVSALILLGGIYLAWQRFRQGERGRNALTLLFLQFEDDLVHRAGVFPETAYRTIPEARAWLKLYNELRFGRDEPNASELRYLRSEAAYVLAKASSRQAVAG